MMQILSESERVIRFRSLRSSTTFASFISFSHRQYEKCFHPLICDSNQFWIVDAIWKFRKILNLIISQRIRPPVLKRPDESAVSVLIKKLNITKTGTPVFFSFFQLYDYPSCMLWLAVKDAISLDESLTDKTNTTANSIARWNLGTMSS